MKIGIISDTHLEENISKIQDILERYLDDADMIIHAGDYISLRVLDFLRQHKRFYGVWGNVDSIEVKDRIREKEILDIQGLRIGIFHGHGTGGSTMDRAYGAFENDSVDAIIFGHSHQPSITTKKGILMLNPGSPTRKRMERWFSCIILEIRDGLMDVQLKLFS